MSIEEKAKAYDEALEKARIYRDNAKVIEEYSAVARYENIFPELRESEDEKIMKAVVKSAEEWYKDNYGYDNPQGKAVVIDAYVAGAIDWLKKQKEQKPISFNEPYNPDEYEVVMEGNATSLKRKEQKSIESIAAEVTKDKESAIKFLKSAGIMDDNGELAEMYRSEQKPADYDHEMWKNCEVNFEGGKKEVIEHPERYGLQKLAEWSEKDEILRVRTINRLETLNFHGIPGKEIRESVDWLRSLRPNKQD